ncbi:deoxyribodipyrimidine photo-lyase [Pleurocapsales cyanobacterium LEGE 10410]|nr:deoxyribodipyrimidine photo-lyase [Pleurocapsales cyanobacterium LEGE 10410]
MQLVWFRRDLRLADNEIVSKACHDGEEVLPFFIIDPWFYQQPEIGYCRVKFLFESLENLDSNLRLRGSQLYLFEGNSVDIIQTITRSLLNLGKQPKLYFNRDVQVNYGIDRDSQILQLYQQQGLKVHLGRNHFLQETENYDTIWLDYHDYQKRSLYSTPRAINTPQLNLDLPQLTIAQLKQKYRRFFEAESYRYLGGEDNAQGTLNSLL